MNRGAANRAARARALSCFALTVALPAAAQDAPAKTLTLDLVLHEPDTFGPVLPPVQWVPGTSCYSQVLHGRSGPYVVSVDAAAGAERAHAFAAAELARALRAAGADAKDADLPPWAWLDQESVRAVHGDAVHHWRVGAERAEVRLRLLPGATAVAYAKGDTAAASIDHADLWISKPDGTLRRVTWDGRAGDIEYGGAAHRAEFGIQGGLFWDPTGRRLAFYREDLRPIAPYPYVDYTVTPPKAVHGRYPMAGRAHSRVTVGLYDRVDDSVRFLEHDPGADEYWTNITFAPDGAKVYVVHVHRGQDQCELVRYCASTGAREAVLLREQDPQWVEPEHGPWFEPGGDGRFLWLSPRDGHHHLYRYAADGRLLGQVTRGAFDVSDVLALPPGGRVVFFEASGDDARQMHLWRADLDGRAQQRLTSGGGTQLATPNHDASAFLVRWSALHDPGGLRILDAAGSTLCEVAAATTALRGFALPRTEFLDVHTPDGAILHGSVTYPPGFDRTQRYPLLLYVYAGPHSQLVTDAWPHGIRELWLTWLATRGCVVATFDGRGTRNRGIEWEQAVHRRLGQIEVEDQICALRHLVSLGFVDPARIGVHGWSYGGYMTLRLMQAAPDLFACGAAGAPVTAWEQYETGYTERFMDTPQENPQGYAASSTLPAVDKVKGRLLLVHGSDDQTVMLSHAMAFLHRAIESGVLIDHMQYPMQKHGFAGTDREHMFRLLSRFFAEHLHLAAVESIRAR